MVCRAEQPGLGQVAREYGDQVQFVGVSNNDTVSEGRKYQREFEVPYPLANDASGRTWAEWRVPYQPVTVVVDQRGRVVCEPTATTRTPDRDALRNRRKSVPASSSGSRPTSRTDDADSRSRKVTPIGRPGPESSRNVHTGGWVGTTESDTSCRPNRPSAR